MSRARWLVSLPASLAIHGAALLLVLWLFPRASLPSAIVLELREVVVNEVQPDRAGPARVASPPTSQARPGAGFGDYRRAELAVSVPLPAPPAPARSSPSESHPPSPPSPLQSPQPGPELAGRASVAAPAIEAPAPGGRPLTIGARQDDQPDRPAAGGVGSTADLKPELGTTSRAAAKGRGAYPFGTGAGEDGSGGGNETPATQAGAGRAGAGGEVSPGLALAVPGARQGGEGSEYGPYLDRLRHQIQASLRYPLAAQRRGLSGTVHMEVVILPTGAVGSVSLVRSSSHPILDEAALDTVRGLPLLPFPPELPLRTLRVRLPVVFELR